MVLKLTFRKYPANTHQLHYTPLHHVTIIIIIIFDTVLRQKENLEHEK